LLLAREEEEFEDREADLFCLRDIDDARETFGLEGGSEGRVIELRVFDLQ